MSAFLSFSSAGKLPHAVRYPPERWVSARGVGIVSFAFHASNLPEGRTGSGQITWRSRACVCRCVGKEECICVTTVVTMNMFSWRLGLNRCDLYLFVSMRTVAERACCIFVFFKWVCMSEGVCLCVNSWQACLWCCVHRSEGILAEVTRWVGGTLGLNEAFSADS